MYYSVSGEFLYSTVEKRRLKWLSVKFVSDTVR